MSDVVTTHLHFGDFSSTALWIAYQMAGKPEQSAPVPNIEIAEKHANVIRETYLLLRYGNKEVKDSGG